MGGKEEKRKRGKEEKRKRGKDEKMNDEEMRVYEYVMKGCNPHIHF